MKILHIIPNLKKGGAERLVLDICRELQNNNSEVLLVTFSELNEYRELIGGINWEVIPSVSGLKFLRGVNSMPVHLEKRILEFKPDIIHTHLYEAEVVARLIHYPEAKWFSHGHDNMRQLRNFHIGSLLKKEHLTDAYEKKHLIKGYRSNGGNHFIAISKDVKRYLEQVMPRDLRVVTLLSNAIDFELFRKPLDWRPASDEKVLRLVNTGSLVDKKNQAFLIEVAAILRSKKVTFKIDLLGDGPNRSKLEDLIRMLSLGDHVILHGNVDNVEQFLWEADLYLHSATYEPFGLVLIEAMAAGLPVVCLDGKGNRDIMKEGKNGYMLSEQDPVAFAGRIIELKEDNDLYKSISEYAVKDAEHFDIKSYVDRLLKLYRSGLQQLNGSNEI